MTGPRKKDELPTDAEFMADPMRWPMMVLPVKKTGGPLGIMMGNGPIVYVGNMYDTVFQEAIRNGTAEKIVYEDFYAVVDDGWKVD